MLQNGEIDVAITEPDAIVAGVPWPAVQFLQVEVLLVEFSGVRRILAGYRDVSDERRGFSPSVSLRDTNQFLAGYDDSRAPVHGTRMLIVRRIPKGVQTSGEVYQGFTRTYTPGESGACVMACRMRGELGEECCCCSFHSGLSGTAVLANS